MASIELRYATHGDARLAELDRPEVHQAVADKLLDVLAERKNERHGLDEGETEARSEAISSMQVTRAKESS